MVCSEEINFTLNPNYFFAKLSLVMSVLYNALGNEAKARQSNHLGN
jgi:hypothetical protein